MFEEALQQYRDYYEDDGDEQAFFEYLGNLSNRDKIRFMELFEDFTVDKTDYKQYFMIPKREYNPELSVMSNMVLDLVDFKDRIRPLSHDVSMLEQAKKYQKQNAADVLESRAKFQELAAEMRGEAMPTEKISEDKGYSSIEAPEEPAEAEVQEEEAEAEAEEEKKE